MKGWLPKKTWELMLASMPIPCTDVVCLNDRNEILLGWRIIPPYKNSWATVGGVILRNEHLETAARRHLQKHGVTVKRLEFNGVFANNCGWRTNISITYLGYGATEPVDGGQEFSKFRWFAKPPKRMGVFYQKMIAQAGGKHQSSLIYDHPDTYEL